MLFHPEESLEGALWSTQRTQAAWRHVCVVSFHSWEGAHEFAGAFRVLIEQTACIQTQHSAKALCPMDSRTIPMPATWTCWDEYGTTADGTRWSESLSAGTEWDRKRMLQHEDGM